MKMYKIIMATLLSVVIWSCSEKKEYGCFPGDDGSSEGLQPEVPQGPEAIIAFADTLVSVLKSSGEIEIPLALSEKVNEEVQVEVRIVDVKGGVKGSDFYVPDELAVVERDTLKGAVRVILSDNGKIDDDWNFTIELSKVQGDPAPARLGDAIRCHVQVSSNSFVAFRKVEVATSEKAHLTDALEIPLMVVGNLEKPVTVKVSPRTVELGNAATAGVNFEIETPEITLEPGATESSIRVRTLNDHAANGMLVGELEITEVSGGNAVIGKAQQRCRLYIDDDNYLVKFNATAVEGSEYDAHLQVELISDRPAEENLQFTVAAIDGTAVAGEHFSLDNAGAVAIPAGSTRGTVSVSPIPDRVVADTRTFELKLDASSDEWAILSPSACLVSLSNGDLPQWNITSFTFEEASGKQTVRLEVKEAPQCDMKLVFANNNLYRLSEEVVFPKGETEHSFEIEVLSDSLNEPAPFDLQVVKVNDLVVKNPDKIAKIELLAGAYRKLLGNWAITVDKPDNCVGSTSVKISKVEWQKRVKVVMSSFWNGKDCYFDLLYDGKTGKTNVVLNQRFQDNNWNFGNGNGNVGLRMLINGKTDLTSVEAIYNAAEGTISLPAERFGGGGANNSMTNKPSVWGCLWTGGSLVKN